mmetsp:Transcript_1670/g.6013  ORF Transcript_1670/g.6013 Transcript_1670/m.6013 type:complete len:211 (-) Transcript_1670:927-1559(-)
MATVTRQARSRTAPDLAMNTFSWCKRYSGSLLLTLGTGPVHSGGPGTGGKGTNSSPSSVTGASTCTGAAGAGFFFAFFSSSFSFVVAVACVSVALTGRDGEAVEVSFLFGLRFSMPPCATDVCMVRIEAKFSVFARFEAGSTAPACGGNFTGDFIKPSWTASKTFLETVRCRPEFRVGATTGFSSFFSSSFFSFVGEGISISILSANIDA